MQRPIYTARLKLRLLREQDAEDIWNYSKTPVFNKHMLFSTCSEQSVHLSIKNSLNKNLPFGELPELGITLRDADKVIGTIMCPVFRGVGELGFGLSERFWGLGITTEAAKCVVEYIFRNSDVDMIQGKCYIGNYGSRKTLQKAGLYYDRTQASYYDKSKDILIFSKMNPYKDFYD